MDAHARHLSYINRAAEAAWDAPDSPRKCGGIPRVSTQIPMKGVIRKWTAVSLPPKKGCKLARAFGDLNEILALLNAAVGELIAGPDPPWAQIRPQPPPAAKFPDRVIRHDDQRTVMASGQLGATIKA